MLLMMLLTIVVGVDDAAANEQVGGDAGDGNGHDGIIILVHYLTNITQLYRSDGNGHDDNENDGN